MKYESWKHGGLDALAVSSGLLLGWAVWQPGGLSWSWLIVLAIWTGCSTQTRRLFLIWFGYYLGALRLPLDSLRDYYPTPQGLWIALLAQFVLALLLAGPFVLCATPRFRSPFRAALAACFGLLTSALPPLASVGLASPFFGASSFFPGCGILGLLAFLGIFALLVATTRALPRERKKEILNASQAIVLAGALVQPLLGITPKGLGLYCPRSVSCPSKTVVPISYPFGPTVKSWSSFLRRARLITHLAQDALQTAPQARLLLFPEAVAGPFNHAFLPLYQRLNTLAREQGVIVALGSTVPWQSRHGTSWSDGLVFLGKAQGELIARQPAPLVEWAPWRSLLNRTTPTMPAFWWWHMSGRSKSNRIRRDDIQFGTHRWAALICYEQALVWPILWTIFHHQPTLLLAPESVHWERKRSIGMLEERMAHAWGRLYALPVAIATNLPPHRPSGESGFLYPTGTGSRLSSKRSGPLAIIPTGSRKATGWLWSQRFETLNPVWSRNIMSSSHALFRASGKQGGYRCVFSGPRIMIHVSTNPLARLCRPKMGWRCLDLSNDHGDLSHENPA